LQFTLPWKQGREVLKIPWKQGRLVFKKCLGNKVGRFLKKKKGNCMPEYLNVHFSNYLNANHIICNMKSTTAKEAYHELLSRVQQNYKNIDVDSLTEFLIAKDNIYSSIVKPELAVPHSRIEGLNNVVIAFGTSQEGIDFQVEGIPPVKVILLILSPKNQPSIYLQVLAGLIQKFQSPELFQKLIQFQTTEDIIKFFYHTPLQIAQYLKVKNIVDRNAVTLTESDSLKTAIHAFVSKNIYDIPIIDEDKDIRGVVSIEDILKYSLPVHLLWMKDLRPIQNFEPVGDILRSDMDTNLADVMRTTYTTIDENVPAIQLAKIFCMNPIRQIIVTSKDKYVGVVTLNNLLLQLFWA